MRGHFGQAGRVETGATTLTVRISLTLLVVLRSAGEADGTCASSGSSSAPTYWFFFLSSARATVRASLGASGLVESGAMNSVFVPFWGEPSRALPSESTIFQPASI